MPYHNRQLNSAPQPPAAGVELLAKFFARDAVKVAKDLLGKVIHHKVGGQWLSAMIIETEAYYKREKGSHSSLGYTEKRSALFMPPGTIYMYYARGGDSLNISCGGEGNGVLIKGGYPFTAREGSADMIAKMQQLNPGSRDGGLRLPARLCAGQTLLCRSLGLKVPAWNQKQFDFKHFFFADHGERPSKIIQARRLGIPKGRDEHLLYRFIAYEYAAFCTKNVLTMRQAREGHDYLIL